MMRTFCIPILILIAHLVQTESSSADTMLQKLKVVILQEIEKDPGNKLLDANEYLQDWCLVKKFNHTVKHRKCFSKTIENNFCYGQCNSMYVPSTEKNPLGICSKCRADRYTYETVTLRCPFAKKKKTRSFRVQKVKSCTCKPCEEEYV